MTTKFFDFKNGYEMNIEDNETRIMRLKSAGPQSVIDKIRVSFKSGLDMYVYGVFDHDELPEDLGLTQYAFTRYTRFLDLPRDILDALIQYLVSLPPTGMYEGWKNLRSSSSSRQSEGNTF